MPYEKKSRAAAPRRDSHEREQTPFYLQAKKSLGQNFLKDASVVVRIVESVLALNVNKNAPVVEIGPGSAALTKPLLESGLQVLAIEKDARAVEGLIQLLQPLFPNAFHVQQQDVLQWEPKVAQTGVPPVCVGNIPYYITSDILLWFCKHRNCFSHGIFMVQDEVADRLAAAHGNKDYGRLSVKIQLLYTVKKLFKVPARCFAPQPKVDSAIVQLSPTTFSFASAVEEKEFEVFCARLFSARRKMLRRIFADGWPHFKLPEKWLELRPEALNPTELLGLFRSL